jgi:peptidoglycan/xylan/chitin deacetylase (PgdA/CDA1 family)
VRQVASGVGLRQVLWTTAVADYTGLSSAAIARQALRNADGRPLVIAMHDGGGPRGNTVAALPAIIDGLRARGYTLVTLCR